MPAACQTNHQLLTAASLRRLGPQVARSGSLAVLLVLGGAGLLSAVSGLFQDGMPRAQGAEPDAAALEKAITKENYTKITYKLTADEVIALMGTPPTETRKTGTNYTLLIWRKSDERWITVKIINSSRKVSGKSCEPFEWDPKQTRELTDEQVKVAFAKTNYDKVQVGMMQDQVLAILGKPSITLEVPDPETKAMSQRMSWYKTELGSFIFVYLVDGKVSRKDTNDPLVKNVAPNPAGKPDLPALKVPATPAEAVAREYWERIKIGMTEMDLLALLGPPSTAGNSVVAQGKHLSWKSENKVIGVVVVNGKVTERYPTDPKTLPSLALVERKLEKGGPGLTRNNFQKVKPGMTLTELTGLLGKPVTNKTVEQGGKMVQVLRWTEGKLEVSVTLAAGKAIAKSVSDEAFAKDDPTAKDFAALREQSKLPDALAKLDSNDGSVRLDGRAFLSRLPFDEEKQKLVAAALMKSLRRGEAVEMDQLADLLCIWAGKDNVPELLKMAKGPKKEVVVPAIKVLVKLKEPGALTPLADHLTDFFERGNSLKALEALGPEAAQSELLQFYFHSDAEVSRPVRELLEKWKVSEGDLLTQALADLQMQNATPRERRPDIRRLNVLGWLDKAAVNAESRKEVSQGLEKALKDTNGLVAHAACGRLEKWGGPENEPALIQALSHPSPDMRQLACRALQKHGGKDSLAALQKLAANSTAKLEKVTKAAQAAMAAIKQR